MSPRTVNRWILCAIWAVAIVGVVICYLNTPLLHWNKLPRVRAALHAASVGVCGIVRSMVEYQQSYVERW
jgi:hypothetical protein